MKKGFSTETAEARAWATVNKLSGGGKKSGSGRKKAKQVYENIDYLYDGCCFSLEDTVGKRHKICSLRARNRFGRILRRTT